MVCQKSWYKYVKEKVQKNWEIGLDSRIQSQKKKIKYEEVRTLNYALSKRGHFEGWV